MNESNPDNVPQDVWDAAKGVLAQLDGTTPDRVSGQVGSLSIVAGAILTERQKPHWRVAISIEGNEVLAIEPEMLAGIPNIDDYADQVRTAAQHLLAFIGPEDPVQPQ